MARTRQYQIQSVFGDGLNPIQPVPVLDWQPVDEIPVLALPSTAGFESVFYNKSPDAAPSVVPDLDWAQTNQNPIPTDFSAIAFPSVFMSEKTTVGIGEGDSPTGWYPPASEPVLPVEFRHEIESYFPDPKIHADAPTPTVTPTVLSLVTARGHPISRHQKRRYAQQNSILLPVAAAGQIGGVLKASARADSAEDSITLTAVNDPADSPATADALRDDLVANALAQLQTRDGELETSVETLASEFNDLLAKLRAAGILSS